MMTARMVARQGMVDALRVVDVSTGNVGAVTGVVVPFPLPTPDGALSPRDGAILRMVARQRGARKRLAFGRCAWRVA